MGKTTQKGQVINVEVEDGKIRLGRAHAVAAQSGEPVTWKCQQPFAVQFPPGSPLAVRNGRGTCTLTRNKDVVLYLPYKYTIAVYEKKSGRVLIVDPVYIEFPPRG